MAKSFKQAPRVEPAPKRVSEKDIFDFLTEERPSAARQTGSAPIQGIPPAKDNIGNTDNPNNSNTHIANSITGVTDVIKEAHDVRQTFVLGQDYLDRLRDYVHTRRAQGQYEYTQKQALHEALDKLFDGFALQERPARIRQQEEERKQRIRRGIGR